MNDTLLHSIEQIETFLTAAGAVEQMIAKAEKGSLIQPATNPTTTTRADQCTWTGAPKMRKKLSFV